MLIMNSNKRKISVPPQGGYCAVAQTTSSFSFLLQNTQ